MTLSRIKRVRGGIGGIETDSDEEVEIDKSGTLASGGIDISYTEHLSKRQKQSHTSGHITSDFQRPTEVQEPIEPQSMKRKLRKQARLFRFRSLLHDNEDEFV
jgi:hypothetical protein